MSYASRPARPAQAKNQTLTFMVVPRSGKVLSFNVASATLKRVAVALMVTCVFAALFAVRYGLMSKKVTELAELKQVNQRQKQQIEAITKELETMRDDLYKVKDTEQKVLDLLRSEREALDKRFAGASGVLSQPAHYRMATAPVVSRSGRDARLGESGAPLVSPLPAQDLSAEVRQSLDETMSALVSTNLSLEQSVAEARALPTLRPVEGSVTSGFGSRRAPFGGSIQFHEGVDLTARHGAVVHAAGDGTVSFSGYKSGFGVAVTVDHGNGFTTTYAHLARSQVTKGQRVSRGSAIGAAGTTGRATGPHLHLEIRKGGRLVDPLDYIR